MSKSGILVFISLIVLTKSLFAVGGDLGVSTDPLTDGSIDHPWLIEDYADFMEFCADCSKWSAGQHTLLLSDLDLAPSLPQRTIYSSAPIAGDTVNDYYFDGTAYLGVFDGNGHVISNLTVQGDYYCGLFGFIDDGAEVHSLGLQNVNIIAGGNYVGGLCGQNDYYNSKISMCYVTGSVVGNNDVGGLCGYSSADISDCYSLASVTGNIYVGGLCGYIYNSSITQCYSVGAVFGNEYFGGLCGSNSRGYIDRSYWNIDTAAVNISAGGWGISNNEMKSGSSFLGWTNGKWTICENQEYPRLSWENGSGDIINTDFPGPTYSGGGYKSSPFQLKTPEDFFCLAKREEDWVLSQRYIVLANNIDFSGYVLDQAIVAYGSMFNAFFDGQGFTISNLIITNTESDNIGLFGSIGFLGQVKNVNISNIQLAGKSDVGGLCGTNAGGIIDKCSVTGFINGIRYNTGGVCGYNMGGDITNCHVSPTVIGYREIGGICGSNAWGQISSCYSTGNVTGSDNYVGGLCGNNYYSSVISQCFASGNITGNGYHVGGLCGGNSSNCTIEECYALGNVVGFNRVGGFAGQNSGDIHNCFQKGSVNGNSWVGGFTGRNFGIIDNCYSMSTISGNISIGAFCGFLSDTDGVINNSCWNAETAGSLPGCILDDQDPGSVSNVLGVSTSAMQLRDTFTNIGWDFDMETENGTADIWKVSQANGYPVLTWQCDIAGDFNGDCSVDLIDFAIITDSWLSGSVWPDLNNDNFIDINDICIIAQNWLTGAYQEYDISEHISKVEIFTAYDYEEPDDPYDLIYDFEFGVITDDFVEHIEFVTPAGKVYTIPNVEEYYSEDSDGWLEAGREYYDDEYEWYYEASFYDESFLEDFGDGEYTINIRYANGDHDSTKVWFGVPGTTQYYLQPTQQPVFTNFQYGDTLISPVSFTWQKYSGIPIKYIWLDIENEDTGWEVEFELAPYSTGLSSPLVLESGEYEFDLMFANFDISFNEEGIEVATGKYAEVDYDVDVE